MDPSSVPLTPSLLSRASIELVEAEVSELETRLEKVTQGPIEMRRVEPGKKLETENESQGLLDANHVE